MKHALLLMLGTAVLSAGGRVTLSLDGAWEIEDSVSATEFPRQFGRHKVPVPGLAHLAVPAFADVDAFEGREWLMNRLWRGELPESAVPRTAGISRQQRNYFWYRTTFHAPARLSEVALLTVDKAQFGTAVWLNRKPVGEHAGCFTAGHFDLTPAMNWDGDNELLIRIGAHPGVVPPNVPAGTDFEKRKWTPGIYDSVSVAFADNPVIENVQVAPRLASSEVIMEAELHNYRSVPIANFGLTYGVGPLKPGGPAVGGGTGPNRLAPGETRKVSIRIKLAEVHLWTPEDPFLYVAQTSTGGDTVSTRFGMREFRFDTPTRRAYLNGRLYFLRGSNITLHRFFEDPQSGALVWNEAWVRRLLIDIPKQMHWNTFRFCIGPVPRKWLEIADEAGLLVQLEYPIWTSSDQWHPDYDAATLEHEYTEWMRDNWNHPSVAWWDAANETLAPVLGEKVIPAVRTLDLSARAWDNGYNVPSGADDPFEDHQYLFSRVGTKGERSGFRITDLERMAGTRTVAELPYATAHAAVLNEYDWLWVNRDGSPTLLTDHVWDAMLGPNATGAERKRSSAYLLAGLTEFWRAGRYYAGILHFVYLTCSYPGVYTSDHWRDVEKLELDPDFARDLGEAFRPLGVYLNFFQPKLKAGQERVFPVVLTNDEPRSLRGTLRLSIERAGGGSVIAHLERPFDVAAWGQTSYTLTLRVPDGASGDIEVRATAAPDKGDPTVSRRITHIEP